MNSLKEWVLYDDEHIHLEFNYITGALRCTRCGASVSSDINKRLAFAKDHIECKGKI